MHKRKNLSAFAAFLLLLGCTQLFLSCAGNKGKDESIKSDEIIRLADWQYYKGDLPKDSMGGYIFSSSNSENTDWTKSNVPDIISENKGGNIVWFKTKLPVFNHYAPAIFVNRTQQLMSVYLDCKKIYDNRCFIPDLGKINALGFRWYMVKLPDSISGKYIYFRFYSKSKEIGMSSPVSLGKADIFLSRIISENLSDMIIGALIIVAGIGMLIVLLFFRRNFFYLGLVLYCFSMGIFIFINNPYINLLFSRVDILYYLDGLLLLFQPSLFMTVEQLVIDKYKKYLRWMWQVHALYIILAVIFTFEDMEDPFFIILLFNSNVSLYMLFRSTSRERMEALILLIGTIVFSLSGTLEIFLYYFNFYSDTWYTHTYAIQWGSLFFVLCLVILVSYRYINGIKQKELVQRKVVEQQQLALEAIQREKNLHEVYTHQLVQSQDNERKKIAMELHDAVGQELLIIKNMAILSLKSKDDPVKAEKLNGYLDEISNTTSGVIENVRTLSRNLHPYQIDNLGLSESLQSIVNRVACTTSIQFICNIEKIDNLLIKEYEVHFYRIVQEIINNIIKHSDATEALINIIQEEGYISACISDNGKGFENQKVNGSFTVHPAGFGISGIYERVNILKGNIEFKSEPDTGGVMVYLKIPFNKKII